MKIPAKFEKAVRAFVTGVSMGAQAIRGFVGPDWEVTVIVLAKVPPKPGESDTGVVMNDSSFDRLIEHLSECRKGNTATYEKGTPVDAIRVEDVLRKSNNGH